MKHNSLDHTHLTCFDINLTRISFNFLEIVFKSFTWHELSLNPSWIFHLTRLSIPINSHLTTNSHTSSLVLTTDSGRDQFGFRRTSFKIAKISEMLFKMLISLSYDRADTHTCCVQIPSLYLDWEKFAQFHFTCLHRFPHFAVAIRLRCYHRGNF